MESTESKLESFFHGMQYYLDVSREARQALASAVAESFSVFDYLQPDENLLSRIIADLLDPKGNHGQASTFLACFLERLIALKCTIPPDWPARVDKATVVNEASTSFLSNSARRIDIRIELPPLFGIGVENKPWAAEQMAQLADYRAELDRRYQGQFVIVFLCQWGRTPESIPDAEWMDLRRSGRCALLRYSDDFLTWISDCHRRTQADKVRHFLSDFARYVRSNLGGTGVGEDQDDVQY
jgi:hypothetical protein